MEIPRNLQADYSQSGVAQNHRNNGEKNISLFKNLFTRSIHNGEPSTFERRLLNSSSDLDLEEAYLREKLLRDQERRRYSTGNCNSGPSPV